MCQFEWDENKALRNLKKHGIDFDEARAVFFDPLAVTIPDPLHSIGESRLITVGLSVAGNLLVVSHREKASAIRLISARRATSKERKQYEKEKTKF
jgi:uncharacterized DUF497 family protein